MALSAKPPAHCQALPLAALGGDEGAEHEPTLDDVYIALNTTSRVPKATPEPSQQRDMRRHWPESEPDSVPLAALDAAAKATRLVLLGDPGAGKSTFVRNVLAWQAKAILSHSDPPPGLAADLLPMLINLRDLAPRLAHLPIDRLAEQDRRQQLAEAVLAQVVEDLQRWQAAGFATGMTEALRSGRCVLVLDGLDEVPPQPPGLRQRVRQAVLAVLSVYHPQRLLVTCRVRSYEGDLKLPNFQAHTLAPFNNKQVEDFIQALVQDTAEIRACGCRASRAAGGRSDPGGTDVGVARTGRQSHVAHHHGADSPARNAPTGRARVPLPSGRGYPVATLAAGENRRRRSHHQRGAGRSAQRWAALA